MSLHDSRMKHQLKENQDIYYAWVEECERLGDPSPLSMKDYKSTVTERLFNNSTKMTKSGKL